MRRLILLFGLFLALTACASTSPTGEAAGHDHVDIEEDYDSSAFESGDVKTVQMTARQFEFEPSTVQVEKGRPVRLNISSTDVPHGIGIPAFGVDKRLPAGETVKVEFVPDETGEFDFICSVYCGSGHSSMTGTLIVE